MIYVYLPLMVLPLYASMEKLDFRLVEAGYDLYATRFRVLTRIIVPLVKPGIVAGSILVFIPSLGAYVTPRVLGGGKQMMLGNLIELQFGAGRKNPRPVGVLLEGKRVDEGADVDRDAGIAVVAPGSADIMGALQQHERVDAVLLQFDGRAHAREAGADDDRFIVGLALGARGAALFDVHMAQVGV